MLQLVGILLAFLTRKVKLRGLRDSKYIAAIIYISSVTFVVMVLINFTLEEFVNIGTGKDCTLKELAEKIAAAVGFKGKITWDPSKPNGTPRKLLDVSKINQLGWKSNITLDSGIKQTYEEYKKSLE